jgi:N-acetylmuramoyl-L-alanine amidase
MELKARVNPQVFEVKPVGEYGHRLVLDVYPLNPPDPLMALLEGRKDAVEPLKMDQDFRTAEKPAEDLSKRAERTEKVPEAPEVHTTRKGKPIVDRLVTITPIPAVAKTPVPSARVGPTRKTSRSKWPSASRHGSMPSRTCVPY